MVQNKGGSARIPQSQRFVEAAQALGCDESEANFEAALKKVARHKPVADKPAPKAPSKR
jgi:hypothetical protein